MGGRSNQTIRNTVADIKAIFNEIKGQFNDEDQGIIKIPGNPLETKGLNENHLGFLQKRYASCKFLSNRLIISLGAIPDVIGIDRLTY